MVRSVRKSTNGVGFLLLGLALALLFLGIGGCGQQAAAPYPSKPIEAVAVFAAGGSQDVIMRYTAPFLQEEFGQPVNIVNKTGAGGATGTLAVLQSPPDGYTVGALGDSNGYLLHAVQTDVPYKWEDLNHVALLAVQPLVFIVKGDSQYNSLPELMADVQKNPEQFQYGSSGTAGPAQFTISALADAVGVDPNRLTRVPFEGGGPTALAVAGGHVDMGTQYVGETIELIRGGQLKALAVVLPERWPALPDVPTFAELGYATTEKSAGPVGIFGPANMPAEVVTKWEDTLARLTEDPDFVAGLQRIGATPLYKNAEDFRAYVEGEYKSALAVAERLGMRK